MNIRPLNHLNSITKKYPDLWLDVTNIRKDKGIKFPEWPSWCFLPMAASLGIITQGEEPTFDDIGDLAKLSAIIAWRYTQGVYRFEPAVYEAISGTQTKGFMPVDVLYRLPEWGVYIETPGLDEHGFFAHLEFDTNTKKTELRILIDSEAALFPIILNVGEWSVEEAVSKANAIAVQNGSLEETHICIDDIIEYQTKMAHHCISLLLYLCSEKPDIERIENNLPHNPKATKIKKGFKLFAPKKPKIWHIGKTLEHEIKCATQESNEQTQNKTRPKAHIRRAHWHGYWTGAKEKQNRKFIYKWQPPLMINVSEVN